MVNCYIPFSHKAYQQHYKLEHLGYNPIHSFISDITKSTSSEIRNPKSEIPIPNKLYYTTLHQLMPICFISRQKFTAFQGFPPMRCILIKIELANKSLRTPLLSIFPNHTPFPHPSTRNAIIKLGIQLIILHFTKILNLSKSQFFNLSYMLLIALNWKEKLNSSS